MPLAAAMVSGDRSLVMLFSTWHRFDMAQSMPVRNGVPLSQWTDQGNGAYVWVDPRCRSRNDQRRSIIEAISDLFHSESPFVESLSRSRKYSCDDSAPAPWSSE